MTYFEEVRCRIAPSPTGDPHVGTAYITLFNSVFAKKNNGKLILRIEDTDQARAKKSSDEMLTKSLNWLGLSWDEGPDKGGEYGPYRQSERTAIYQEHTRALIENGGAYRCFCTKERLAELREVQKKEGSRYGYDRKCRNLSHAEVEDEMAKGIPFVVRMKMPTDGSTVFQDAIRGDIEIQNGQVDDQILLKSDGFPTYHLANVVDDHLMKISHVMRAEEWISSTPKHVVLYDLFGWEKPTFVHLPLLRNQDKSKISKRKNPVSLMYYKQKGILPKAMVNFLSLMGWAYSDDQEIFTFDEMVEKFELKDIHLGGPVFDVTKLLRVNQHYLHQVKSEDFADYIRENLFSKERLMALHEISLERMSSYQEFIEKNDFFFTGALNYKDIDLIPKGKDKVALRKMLKSLVENLDELYEWNREKIEETIKSHMKEIEWKPRDYFMPIRMVVSGRKDSPPLMEMIEILGREMTRFRIRNAMEFLK